MASVSPSQRITIGEARIWRRYLACPGCGKRHDPKNYLLELGYHGEYWAVEKC